jgi:hypothetical protein
LTVPGAEKHGSGSLTPRGDYVLLIDADAVDDLAAVRPDRLDLVAANGFAALCGVRNVL